MMLRGDSAVPESSPKSRRPTPSGASGLILALTPPPTAARNEALWPSWLSPIGATWKRPASAASSAASQRSE